MIVNQSIFDFIFHYRSSYDFIWINTIYVSVCVVVLGLKAEQC